MRSGVQLLRIIGGKEAEAHKTTNPPGRVFAPKTRQAQEHERVQLSQQIQEEDEISLNSAVWIRQAVNSMLEPYY